MPCADEDEIPDQREPRRRKRDGPGASRFEQALAVFADGMPLRLSRTEGPRGAVRNSGRTSAEAIARHAR